MVHQGIERRDGVQAQLDWEALSLASPSFSLHPVVSIYFSGNSR